MRQFYLGKTSSGYYKAYFIDPVTGCRDYGKSTGTKDKIEAAIIANDWLKNGKPTAHANSRKLKSDDSLLVPTSLKSFVDRLSEAEAKTVMSMLSQKFGFTSPVVSQKPVEVGEPVVETLAPVPVPSSAEVVKPKKVIVIKKTADGKMQLVKNKKQVVKDGSSSVPSIGLTSDGKHLLCDNLENFWDYDTSVFIKRQLDRGHSLSKKYAFCMKSFVRNYWRPYFGDDMCIEDLTVPDLDDFLFYLHDAKELASETINKNINCVNRCLNWLAKQQKIKVNPVASVERFKVDADERDIPTEQEIRSLLALDWENHSAKLAFKVAAFYGLRAGEISGLRVCDIDVVADMLYVRHSYSEMDGLKSTKNKEIRELPIDHALALQLMSQARLNPEFGDLSYVFWSVKNHKMPITPGYYGDCFYKALEEIGVSEAVRKDRNIVFHSLRHFCCTILKQRADKEIVMEIMGHKSGRMTDHYSDHETQEKFDNMRTIISGAWEKYISA
ncbi:MAG: tyrosine-type recombinase/integrase [Treponema sp.]|nr:tyrosine-type recombinase/integrase [Treponema sp.]